MEEIRDITRYQWFCGPVPITEVEAQTISDDRRSPLLGPLRFVWYERVPTSYHPAWRTRVISGEELRELLQ